MPQTPTDLIDDLITMGLYQPQALDLADTLTQVELKEALFLHNVSDGSPDRKRLCQELIKEAGGVGSGICCCIWFPIGCFFWQHDSQSCSAVAHF
ncbi:hypothetical protein [Myxacorys almedinensis]|nr:hypothetical protein [Myxacorys almedinensis]